MALFLDRRTSADRFDFGINSFWSDCFPDQERIEDSIPNMGLRIMLCYGNG